MSNIRVVTGIPETGCTAAIAAVMRADMMIYRHCIAEFILAPITKQSANHSLDIASCSSDR